MPASISGLARSTGALPLPPREKFDLKPTLKVDGFRGWQWKISRGRGNPRCPHIRVSVHAQAS